MRQQLFIISRFIGKLLLHALLLLCTVWVSLLLWVQVPFTTGLFATPLKAGLISLFWLIFILVLIAINPASGLSHKVFPGKPPVYRAFAVGSYLLLLVLAAGWWVSLKPQQQRDWAPDVSQVLHVEQQGNQVTLHHVRNFDWRSTTDFAQRWETRQYDISQLRSVDVINSYWMGPAIAHTLVSFGFDDGQYLTFSIETRRERQEQFSAINGFFRKYELSLIAADERDIIYTRSNVRGEKVYLYRVNVSKPTIQRLFNAYLDEARQLEQQPAFYNSLTSNCTTIIFHMARLIEPQLPNDYRIILSGYLPQYLYAQHALFNSVPFRTLQQRAFINQYVMPALQTFSPDSSQNFSQQTPPPALIERYSQINSASYSKVIRQGLTRQR